MANRYEVTTRWHGVRHAIPIHHRVFLDVRKARDLLVACIEIEEAYDIAVSGYLAFETAMMKTVVDAIVDRAIHRVELDAARRELERELIGLLASAEMYVSHAEFRVKPLERSRAIPTPVLAAAVATQKAALLGFRAGEQLRHAVLHRKMPISSWTMGSVWLDHEDDEARRLQHTVTISFDPELLEVKRAGAADPQLAADLAARADADGRVRWVPIIREYVEGLSGLHTALREALRPAEGAAVDLLAKLAGDYRGAFPKDRPPVSVIAVEVDAQGRRLDEIALDFDYEERVGWLRRRNRRLVNLNRRQLSG